MHAHVAEVGSQDLDRDFTLFVANGVTTVRGMLGRPSHLHLRQQLLDGEQFGPRLITSGPSLNGNTVSSPADGVRKVRAQHAAGYDFIKIHPGLSASEFSAIASAANELGMPYAGHVPVSVGVFGALDAGMTTIDHLDGYVAALMPADSDLSGGYGGFFDVLLSDQVVEERLEELVSRTVAAGTWNVPTQSLVEQLVNDTSVSDLANRSEMRYMPRATVDRWIEAKQSQLNERGFSPELGARAIDIRRQIILALHEAGAGLLLGSDAPQIFNVPGFSLHHELEFLVAAGLTPFDALRTGTTAVAEFLGTNTGIVAVGKDADLVLLNANPLADIGNSRRVHGVMLRGNWISYAEIEDRLKSLTARHE
jgi:imidazolonepropionase-like amidohydrolase